MKKKSIKSISISDYSYPLPDHRIAKYPLVVRDQSKLLVYSDGTIKLRNFYELPELVPQGSLMIFNNTRVIHARLLFKKETGATIEIFCLSPDTPKDYALSFEQTESTRWNCMVGNARKWKHEVLLMNLEGEHGKVTLSARKVESDDKEQKIEFSWNNPAYSFSELLEKAGNLPIPPYLNRATEEEDEKTYQTVYSRIEGSVAAPTAGLHFTENVMNALQQKNITLTQVTLHVGAGTFRPVKSNEIGLHEMHRELISVNRETIEQLLHTAGRVVVVGTTSLRTIESLYYLGVKILQNPNSQLHNFSVEQWEPYQPENNRFTPNESLTALFTYMKSNHMDRLVASTKIMIAPGYEFKFVDGLATNFHQPQSTLLLLVSAFVGEEWKEIYQFALNNNFRFLSYGDSSLLWRKRK